MISEYVKKMREKIGHMAMFSPVVTLVICKDNKVLLQRRKDTGTWAIHGGGSDPGETFTTTLYREIKEELNIVPKDPILYGIFTGEDFFNVYPNGDEVYVQNHVFFCEDYTGEISFNDGEVTEVKWFSLDELPKDILEVDKPIIYNIKNYINNGKKPIVI